MARKECVSPRHHIKATPLFEFSAVSIHTETFKDLHGHDSHIELYGQVKFIDDNDTEFYLFNRDIGEAEAVDLLGCLSVILRGSQHGHPQWLPKFCHLDLCLKDRLRNTVIVEELFYLDFNREVVYDEEQYLPCYAKGHTIGFLTYTVFPYAVIASVDCTLLRNENPDNNDSVGRDDLHLHAVVEGSISATCMVRNRYVSRILVDKLSTFARSEVSRTCWLAVPAYSPTLKIEANLKVDGKNYNSGDTLEFKVFDESVAPYKRDIVVGKWLIRVCVSWRHAFYFLGEGGYLRECDFNSDVETASLEESEQELSDSEASSSAEDNSLEKRQEKLISIEDLLSGERTDPLPSIVPLHLVEVFSIAVFTYDGDDDSPLSLHGTIKVHDTIGSYDMFNRNETDLSLVHPRRDILCIIEPRRCFMGNNFGIDFDLRDCQGHEISKGYLAWDYSTVTGWHDRRICSVVPGKDGFAAVHYTIFENAVQAKMKVVFRSGNDHDCQVRGRICTRYTDYRYFTCYEKRYYESILFEKEKLECVNLGDGDEVPLSKSVVCVPLDVSLIVKADFRVLVGGKCVEKLRGKVLFKAQEPHEPNIQSLPQSIKGSNYAISVYVDWG